MPARPATGKSPRADGVAGSQPPWVTEGPPAKPTPAPHEGSPGRRPEASPVLVAAPLGSAEV